MIDGEETRRLLLTDYLVDNRDTFKEMRAAGKKEINKISKNFPPDLHCKVRDEILGWVGANGLNFSFRFTFTVDSNIIVADSFRVAKEKPSSTPRIFSCPYVELVSHKNIRDEVLEAIEKDLPKGANKQKAVEHAKYLLSQINTVPNPTSNSLKEATKAIGNIDPDDVPFLAVALTTNSNAMISRDRKAYSSQNLIRSWGIKEYANIVSVTEGGMLSLYFLAKAGISIMKLIEYLITILFIIFSEILDELIKFLGNVVKSVTEAFEKMPPHLKELLGLTGAASFFVVALNENARNYLKEVLRMVKETLAEFLDNFKARMMNLFNGIREIIVLLWNEVVPSAAMVVVIAGVLWDTVSELIEECEKLTKTNASVPAK